MDENIYRHHNSHGGNYDGIFLSTSDFVEKTRPFWKQLFKTLINNVKLVNTIGIKHKKFPPWEFLVWNHIFWKKQYSMKNEINNTFQELLRLFW